jgi:FkbM family methyltransferase
MLQKLKDRLVALGPQNRLTQMALNWHARGKGYKLDFSDPARIWIVKGDRRLALAPRDLTFVPVMLDVFDVFFSSIVPQTIDGVQQLDFSQPGLHTYQRSGKSFYCASIPEEEPLEQYTHWYTPQPGDIVWDAGAYSGATACMLADLVGPTGKVYSFEPDDLNYSYLMKNLEYHSVTNVIPVRKALSATTGTTTFFMNGTMASGIRDFVVYSDDQQTREVPTISMADACAELGCSPTFIKMDIEGAELAFIEGAKDYLSNHPTHFAIETAHRVGGEYTDKRIEAIFTEIGYKSHSSEEFSQMFTWASPPVA